MISIRPAVLEDVSLVRRFIRELAEHESLAHEVEATEDDLRAALFHDRPKVFCDLAEWAAEPAGCAVWFYSFSSFKGRHGICLADLYVRPEHRGRGIGRALLAGLARRCAVERLGRLEWAASDSNASAIAFYKSLGARPLSDGATYRLTDEALLALAETEEKPCSS